MNTPASERYVQLNTIVVASGVATGTIEGGVTNTPQVGDRVLISGGESQEDGIHTLTVVDIPGSEIEWSTAGADATEPDLETFVDPARMATIDAQLSVRNIIQAIAYT